MKGAAMKFGEVEVKRIPARAMPCDKDSESHNRISVAYYNGKPLCGQCFVHELLSEPDAQELLGQLLADLIPDEPKELPQPLNSGFQTVVPR
jgi:hypothetical protein